MKTVPRKQKVQPEALKAREVDRNAGAKDVAPSKALAETGAARPAVKTTFEAAKPIEREAQAPKLPSLVVLDGGLPHGTDFRTGAPVRTPTLSPQQQAQNATLGSVLQQARDVTASGRKANVFIDLNLVSVDGAKDFVRQVRANGGQVTFVARPGQDFAEAQQLASSVSGGEVVPSGSASDASASGPVPQLSMSKDHATLTREVESRGEVLVAVVDGLATNGRSADRAATNPNLIKIALGEGPAATFKIEFEPHIGELVTHGNRSPRDIEYRKPVERAVPKRADFKVDGLSKLDAAGVKRIFDKNVTITRPDGTKAEINLMKAKNDTVAVDDFYAAIEEVLKKERFEITAEHAADLGVTTKPVNGVVKLTGDDVMKRVDAVIAEAVRLSEKIPPEASPIPNESPAMRAEFLRMMRRFAMQGVFHTMDLTKVHTAMGFDPKSAPEMNETLKHDMVGWVPLKDLGWQLSRRYHEPWMDGWLKAEIVRQKPELLKGNETPAELYAIADAHPELKFNPSALNPNFIVAMYRWGDSREDSNVLMDPHRLDPHHNGNSADDIQPQLRAVNFLSHHMPREHFGVRHESRGDWNNLDHALSTDPAIKDSSLLRTIAADGANFFKAMEEQGFAVPWQKLAVPHRPQFVQLDGAYQALQVNNVAADKVRATQTAAAQKALPAASAVVRQQGEALLAQLGSVNNKSDVATLTKAANEVSSAVDSLFAAAKTDADRAAATALGMASVARLTQLAPRTVETTKLLVPAAEALEQKLFDFDVSLRPEDGTLFMGYEQALISREKLEQLPAAIKEAQDQKDSSTAMAYQSWKTLIDGGLDSLGN